MNQFPGNDVNTDLEQPAQSLGKALDEYGNKVVEQLIEEFKRIEKERMQDIPIVNHELKVEAVNFHYWQEQFIGILITPWFMNLILLPKQDEDWNQLVPGTREEFIYPAKSCTFVVNELENFGFYKSHPLHSPMFQFEVQDDAVAVAESFLENLLDENVEFEEVLGVDAIDKIMTAAAVKHLNDKEPLSSIVSKEEPEGEPSEERAPISERLEKPISRRELLRGSFLS